MVEKNMINLRQRIEHDTIDVQQAEEDRLLIEGAARRKEFSSLYGLALTLETITAELQGDAFDLARYDHAERAQVYLEQIYLSIERALYLYPGGIDTLFELTRLQPAFFMSHKLQSHWFNCSLQCRQRERYYAAKIVAYQQADDVLAALERHAAQEEYAELLFLLVHELVIQTPGEGKELSHHPLLRTIHQRMREQMHPLGWLPLSKTVLEQHIKGCQPRFNPYARALGSYEFVLSHWGSGSSDPNEPGILPSAIGFARVKQIPATNDTAYRSISSAVLNWMVESNGKFEVQCIAFNAPFPPEHFTPSMLGACGFQALDGVEVEAITFQPISAQGVYAILFRSAAIGGDLGGGCFGAYGRLYAWQSLAGLAGIPPGASLETVLEAAQHCTCRYVWAPSQWFEQVVTEFGLLVLRPDRRSAAFLAATDSD